MNTNPDYEPKRDLWPVYEPWMRDLLTDDARMSRRSDVGWYTEVREPWADARDNGCFLDSHLADWDTRVHPEDCPDTPPVPADPVEGLAKAIEDAWRGEDTDDNHDIAVIAARTALDHIEAGGKS